MTTPTDPTTLAAWLPILQHPEVGDRVCEAAGVDNYWRNSLVSPVYEEPRWEGPQDQLPTVILAALAFGVLSVLEDSALNGCIDSQHELVNLIDGCNLRSPAAILAAAYRVWLDE